MTISERSQTAKAIRGIRKLLKGNPPSVDNSPSLLGLYRLNEDKIARIGQIVFIIIALGCIVFLLCGCNDPAFAYTEKDAIKAVIGEAEGESQEGKKAVACAIHYRGTLKGVYGLTAKRVLNHKYSELTYRNAKQAVEASNDEEYCEGLVKGAQYWEGISFPTPSWAKNMTLTTIIGNQRFYRKESNV